jgi:citrate synthase
MSDEHGDDWQAVNQWWSTEIIDMEPGRIAIRGYEIEDLIGRLGFAQMIWLMLRGDLPTMAQSALFEAALVAAVDHGPQAPSIGIARMAMTCGVGINNAMASAVNALGDVHGGAGEAAAGLYHDIAADSDAPLDAAVAAGLDRFRAASGPYIPGFGHRFHPVDPRAPRLMALVAEAVAAGIVTGRFRAIAMAIEAQLRAEKSRAVLMNIDGATAVIFTELGFEPGLQRGLFCLSRSVGILAHAHEQRSQGGRNKGATPPQFLWNYTGPRGRTLPD